MTDPLPTRPARAPSSTTEPVTTRPARAARRARVVAAALLGAAALATPLIGLTAGLYTDVEEVRGGITAGTWQTPTPTPGASEEPTESGPATP